MSRGILELNEITGQIIAAALKVHTVIGPGLLESVYQTCVHHELQKRGLESQIEVPLPVIYEDLRVDSKFRLDLIVENCVIVEFKCVDVILPIHKAQLLTYLRLANLPSRVTPELQCRSLERRNQADLEQQISTLDRSRSKLI